MRDATPSLSQAQRMKKLSQMGRLDMDTIFAIMTRGKGKPEGNRENRHGQAAEIFPQRHNAKADGGFYSPLIRA